MSSTSKFLTISSALAAGFAATPAFAEGAYWGGFIGAVSPEDFDINEADELSADTGVIFGGVLGARFGDNMRAEAEVSYWSADADCSGKCGDTEYDVEALSVLGNLWFDFGGDMGFRPYVGGGVGAANVSLDSSSGEADSWALSYQAGLGARFGSEGAMTFDLGYRYKGVSEGDLGDHPLVSEDIDLTAHVVQLGISLEY